MAIINRDYEIPYLAGYSTDGKTIYIDKRMPESTVFGGVMVNTDQYLVVHESSEKHLEDTFHVEYARAHQIATDIERQAVEAAGISWKDYNSFMQGWIRRLLYFTGPVPFDLDLKPERDEHAADIIRQVELIWTHMRKCGIK